MNFNCILCKYCNNEIGCNKVISENNLWHCPSLSNIYYGRLIKYFPFNIIDKVNTYIECSDMKNIILMNMRQKTQSLFGELNLGIVYLRQ